jgi:hypothetical protein
MSLGRLIIQRSRRQIVEVEPGDGVIDGLTIERYMDRPDGIIRYPRG